MSTTLTVRMDEDLKKRFSEIAQSVGLDAPTVMRMLAVQTVRDRMIPLSLSAVPPNDTQELTWLDEVRAPWGEW
ncbi:MAG: type II toxin-antitoxin system RelB/DinJ family antitoxin [Propionibacteriaceae bacterium]|nr:type II toxin-antitoxin system RelB/DinJ family antitoxin [Propionibacteriaceae bacterium]